MSNHRDPAKGSAEDRELRRRLDEISQRRAQREREWDALLAERDRQIHQTGMAAELDVKLVELKRQATDLLAEAELADDNGADEPAVRLPLPEDGIFPSAEEAIAAAGPWSPDFQAWRKQHIPSSRGLF